MPQLNKGGKFVFGISRIREGGELFLPPQAMEEYGICREGRIYIFTGARATGGFCVTRKGLLAPSQLGRRYGWLTVSQSGRLLLTEFLLHQLDLNIGAELLCIRSSDIAFTLGAKGPLLERAKSYSGEIPVY